MTYNIRFSIDQFDDGMPPTDGHVIWYNNITVTTTNYVLMTNQ